MKFLKNFGLGLLYALLFPVILAAVAVFAVYGFLKSIVYFFIYLVRFFKGEKIFAAFPEDEKAKEIIDRAPTKHLRAAELLSKPRAPAAGAATPTARPSKPWLSPTRFAKPRLSSARDSQPRLSQSAFLWSAAPALWPATVLWRPALSARSAAARLWRANSRYSSTAGASHSSA